MLRVRLNIVVVLIVLALVGWSVLLMEPLTCYEPSTTQPSVALYPTIVPLDKQEKQE